LNESEGNILDNVKVLVTLISLKKEASEITQKVQETESIMQKVIAQYASLALIEHFYEIFQYIHENSIFLSVFTFIIV